MKMMMITVGGAMPILVEVPDTDYLKKMYELIQCDYVEITTRNIGGKEYVIICDECGKLKHNQIITATSTDTNWVGNLLVCRWNKDRTDFIGLDKEDYEYLMSYVRCGYSYNTATKDMERRFWLSVDSLDRARCFMGGWRYDD